MLDTSPTGELLDNGFSNASGIVIRYLVVHFHAEQPRAHRLLIRSRPGTSALRPARASIFSWFSSLPHVWC